MQGSPSFLVSRVDVDGVVAYQRIHSIRAAGDAGRVQRSEAKLGDGSHVGPGFQKQVSDAHLIAHDGPCVHTIEQRAASSE